MMWCKSSDALLWITLLYAAAAAATVSSSSSSSSSSDNTAASTDPMAAWRKSLSDLPPLSLKPFRRLQEASSNSNNNNNSSSSRHQQDMMSSLWDFKSPPTVILDYGDRHPWGQHQQQQQQRDLKFFWQAANAGSSSASSSSSSATTTATTTSSSSTTYQPIRMKFVTDPIQSKLGQDTTTDTKINYILSTVLPEVSRIWSSHLRVVPNASPIPIDDDTSVCFGMFHGLLSSDVMTNGVANADLVILTSMADSLVTSDGTVEDFCSTGVLAVASFCSTDQYDRPTIGFINFCPPTSSSSTSSTSLQASTSYNNGGGGRTRRRIRKLFSSSFPKQITAVSQQDDILVAVHEVGHVLGMSIELFPYFRDPLTGEPLTPRPIATTQVECTNNRGTKSMIFPSSKIIQSGTTTTNGLLYYDIVTPRVQSVVRNHFDCQTLNGARLEIQDTSATSCVGSHWDERLQYSELMSPIFSGTADILSPLTLALMEDSGWYQVNYGGNSSLSPFGQGAGCNFVNELCIVNDAVPSWGKDYFCATPTKVRSDGTVYINDNNVVCDPNHYQMTLCTLFDQTQVPFGFLTNNQVDIITYFSDQNLVGTFEQASFCPMPIFTTNIDCTDATTKQLVTYQGEQYGSSSRCVNANFQDPTSGNKVVMPGCFNIQCDRPNFRVVVNGIPCDYDFQPITIQTTSYTSATMECPRLSTICPDLFCPEDCSGRGICQYDSNHAQAPQCQCSDSNVTAPDCQNGTLPAAVPIYYSQQHSRASTTTRPPNRLLLLCSMVVGGALLPLFLQLL